MARKPPARGGCTVRRPQGEMAARQRKQLPIAERVKEFNPPIKLEIMDATKMSQLIELSEGNPTGLQLVIQLRLKLNASVARVEQDRQTSLGEPD
jgi:hypothetical protein